MKAGEAGLVDLATSGPPFSSVGRALAWHARGQGFESPKLHQEVFTF